MIRRYSRYSTARGGTVESEQRCHRCACRLSRYNPDVGLCGPCARSAPPTPVPSPASVPHEVWSDSEIQDALRSLEFGRLSRLVRRRAGLRQEDMAQITGLSQGYLSQLESGARRLSRLDKTQAFLDALGVPADLVPLLAAPEQQASAAPSARGPSAPVDPPDLHAVAAGAAASSSDFADLVTPSNVDDAVVEELSFTLARIATEYVHAPLHPLFTELVAVRDRLFELLQGRQRPQQSRDLFMLTGTTCLLLAHASQNLGDQASALAQVRTARVCAEQADHTGLRAWTLGTAALITEWSPQRRMSLKLTAQAAALAPAGESRIRIAAMEARTAARIGDGHRANQAIERLQRAMDEVPEEDGVGQFGGILTFPRAKQDYYLGSTYALLGRPDEAQRHTQAAIEAYRTGPQEERSYGDEALAHVDLITVGVQQDDLDGAVAAFQHVLELPPELRIRQLGSAVGRLASLLDRPALKGNRAASEIAELIRDYRVFDQKSALPSGR
ncbi:helix-turn-helix domain-containing protein [Streptomyces monticola]|uniref:Helix-turn-helix domain-containing protein n=1 Tax=Streptomyces monticola TaxID=2666263 RepID=A0ABW2JL27_9ACTN